MPELLTGLEIPLGFEDLDEALLRAAAARLGVRAAALLGADLTRRSLDARKRHQPRWVCSATVWRVGEEAARAAALADAEARLLPDFGSAPAISRAPHRGERPIIVGTGPAGLFAALTLAERGVPSILLDRGKQLSERHLDVRRFRRKGELDPESNLCFGEGGAGTYSDGKLYTRKHHPLVRHVYERLVAFGGTRDILTAAHPHIGTNRLYAILEALRAWLIDRGVEVRFQARVERLLLEHGAACGVVLAGGEELRGAPVILAMGHSARETYRELAAQGVALLPKPFAIGARVEHPQALIDEVQLGPVRRAPGVEAAEYFLSCRVGARGVYSFCMCPGGFIIPTPTELDHLNVNGMSNSNRGSPWANAALVVTVEPADFWIEAPGDLAAHGALAGIEFQREWEARAYRLGGGGYRAPAQRLADFVAGRPSADLPQRVSYRPGLTPAELRGALPGPVVEALRAGARQLDRSLHGFLTNEAVLVGVETTTSTPVRILRGPDRQSPSVPGLYPTGEGAGWAGGIVSSAIDGVETARAVLEARFPERA